MAPLTKTTVALAFAACSAITAFGAPAAQKTPDTIATIVNLARRGKLDVLVEKVAFDAVIADAVAAEIPALAGADTTCTDIDAVTPATAKGLFSVLPLGSPDWTATIQKVLDDGLAAFPAYPAEPWSASAPWNDAVKANLGYLLWSTSTKIGCAYTTDCTAKNLLICRFTPTAADSQHPFSAQYFEAIKARTVKLYEMAPSDVDGNPQTGSAFTALPSLLLGFIGAAVSLLFA